MIPPIQCIKKVLWGNVRLSNGTLVPVIKRSYPYDKTPCITIDDSGSSSFQDRHILNVPYPVDKTHPQFDKDEPFKKVPQQVMREYYSTSININTWSDSISEQEELNNIISDLFYKAQSDHYMFCKYYDNHECTNMGCACYGEYFPHDKRGVKHQCPNPSVYGYSNIFTTYHLTRSTFHLDPAFNLEDDNVDEIVYHSVLRLTTEYYIDHIIGGLEMNTVDVEETIL